MNWYLQLISLAYNVEHGMIPAAIPELRERYDTTPLEEALLQCLCVIGIQIGIVLMWKVPLVKSYLALSVAVIAATNFAAAYCVSQYSGPHPLYWLYLTRVISGLAASYPIHAVPKWINQTSHTHKTISKQANIQLTGVAGTVFGYLLILCSPLVTQAPVASSFVTAGLISAATAAAGLAFTTTSEYAKIKLDICQGEPAEDERWYDLSSLMTPVRTNAAMSSNSPLLNNFEFSCITCAIGINSSACQALAFWILTVYISSMGLSRAKALTGISIVFGVGAAAGLALSGAVTRLGKRQRSTCQVLRSRLMWMSIFCFITSIAGIYGYFYGHRGFWDLTIAMAISVLFGAATTPLAQSAIGNCAKNFEDIAYGIYQTVFQSSWFFGPLLPVLIAKAFSSQAEVAGIKGVMVTPFLAFLCTLTAYCHCAWRNVKITEDQIELSWGPYLETL